MGEGIQPPLRAQGLEVGGLGGDEAEGGVGHGQHLLALRGAGVLLEHLAEIFAALRHLVLATEPLIARRGVLPGLQLSELMPQGVEPSDVAIDELTVQGRPLRLAEGLVPFEGLPDEIARAVRPRPAGVDDAAPDLPGLPGPIVGGVVLEPDVEGHGDAEDRHRQPRHGQPAHAPDLVEHDQADAPARGPEHQIHAQVQDLRDVVLAAVVHEAGGSAQILSKGRSEGFSPSKLRSTPLSPRWLAMWTGRFHTL